MTLKNTCLECGAPSRTYFCLDCIEREQAAEESLREREDLAFLTGLSVDEVTRITRKLEEE
jgi:hypothetical protein